ncbi:MAG: hypothetical protein LAO08_11570 [Acidobacteriia bacterium]|nr:hypothetical protein [Terriglobia bacterium]
MKTNSRLRTAAFAAGLFLLAWPAHLAAQAPGRIDFTARVAPTGGRPEPVRQLTFYLLRKSMDDIRSEALQLEPAPDLDKFVDALSVSHELKAWLKKHRSVNLSGADFTKSLTPDDIVVVPEFYDAYMKRNLGFKGVGFPKAKFKEKDRESNPEKYKQEKDEYTAAIRRFIGAVPESVQGIDIDLADKNPSATWEHLRDGHKQRLESRITELAQQRYLAGQTDTDLDGQGSFAGIAPGTYWISMIGIQAISGDVRLRWDLPVAVRPGETTRVELSNLNATKTNDTAQNSDH